MTLFNQPIQDHLTPAPFDTKARSTHPGMAHFAGTSAERASCRECMFWTGCGGEKGRFARKGMSGGGLKDRSCEKYKQLCAGEIGPRVPPEAAACKYFERSPNPPPQFERSGS